jgi:iron complex transport system substrate-binding protein
VKLAARGAHVALAMLLALTMWSPATAQPLSVVDDAGQKLELAGPARRIVALSPHVTELLFAVGAGDRVVGVDAWSNYPAQARRLPRVGDLYALDLERIVALKPDLLVVWHNGNSQRQLDVLRGLGLPIYFDGPRRLADIPHSLEQMGKLAGSVQQADAVAAAMRARVQTLRERHAHQRQVSVFYQVWTKPLLTVNATTLIGDVITLCGGDNIFGQLPMQVPRVAIEAVIEADPQVIVAASLGQIGADAADVGDAANAESMPADTPGKGSTSAAAASHPASTVKAMPGDSAARADFSLWRTWPRLRAVRQHHLVALSDDLISRHTPRVLDGAERLCTALDAARRLP